MYITYIIIGITALVSFYAFSNGNVLRSLILNPYMVSSQGQYYRFITSGFIHLDQGHLFFNMLSLYFFGPVIEKVFGVIFGSLGSAYFIVLYLLAIIVSDIPSYLKHRNNRAYNSLGASGGVAAVIFAFILFLPLENIYIFFAIPVPGFILGILYVIFSWYMSKRGGDNINHDAHLFGALFGFIYCIVLYPPAFGIFIEQIKNWDITKGFL